MRAETIQLDGMDGFGFEMLCERMFDRAGWGEVTRIGGVADRGRDLVIRAQDGTLTIVECKMYGDTVVGRPVVQKLHSAVIDSNADRGIIVTTGRFSRSAVEYAADIGRRGHTIELFDMHRLMEIAHEAGFELETGRMQKIHTYPALDRDGVERGLRPLINRLDSHPLPAADVLRLDDIHPRLRAMYSASISIEQSFSASAGTIHTTNVRDQHCMFDGMTGERDGSDAAGFFGRPGADTHGMPYSDHFKTSFGMDASAMRQSIASGMSAEYATRVSYTGRNGTTYEKECVPAARNVRIDDMRQVYVPSLHVTLGTPEYDHACVVEFNGTEYRVMDPTWNKCHECGSSDNLMLCNECGRVAHESRFGSHGFRCRECGKTICNLCAWRSRRMMVFSSRFCSDCRPDGAVQGA